MAAGDATQGRRVPPDTKPWDLEPGDYTVVDGVPWARLPDGFGPCRLKGWAVTENDDGTITLAPSILARVPPDGEPGWHGFLERGVFREV